jgi:ribosomal 50S subunit-recycling heat shock protein
MQYPEPVAPDELTARYMLEKSKFSVQNARVKASAYMPANDNVLSVFRIERLSKVQVIELGEEFVSIPQSRDLLAYAVLSANEFVAQGLTLVPTREPHPRHIDVEGWTDSVLNRARAHFLAESARLELK